MWPELTADGSSLDSRVQSRGMAFKLELKDNSDLGGCVVEGHCLESERCQGTESLHGSPNRGCKRLADAGSKLVVYNTVRPPVFLSDHF